MNDKCLTERALVGSLRLLICATNIFLLFARLLDASLESAEYKIFQDVGRQKSQKENKTNFYYKLASLSSGVYKIVKRKENKIEIKRANKISSLTVVQLKGMIKESLRG